MSKRFLAVILVVVMLAAVLAGCSNPAPEDTNTDPNPSPSSDVVSDEPEYVIKWASIYPQGGFTDTMFETPIKEYLEEASNGRLSMEIYYSGSLAAQGQIYQAIINGTADAGYDVPDQYTGSFPYTLLFNTPGWYLGDTEETYNVLVDYLTTYEDTYLTDNFKVVAWQLSPGIGMLSNGNPIENVEQLKGLSVRALSAQVDWLTAMNVNCVSMGISDVYESFRLNVIDGCITGITAITSFKFPEVCDYYTFLPMINGATNYVFSKALYDSFDADLQKALDDTFAYAQSIALNDTVAKTEEAFTAAVEMNPDFVFADLPAAEVKKMCDYAVPVLEAQVELINSQGLDGTGAYEFLLDHVK